MFFQNKKNIGKTNKSGQGSLIAVVLGSVLLATIVASGTSWYLSMRNNLGNTEDKLEAQTIAQSEWERLSHMSLDELEANRETFKTPYLAGTESQFSISVNLGEKGTFNNGTCGAVSGGYANCFKDTTITVYRDGSRLFTTRTLPLMAGDYTRQEIDSLLASMKNDYTSKFGNYYTKGEVDKKISDMQTIITNKMGHGEIVDMFHSSVHGGNSDNGWSKSGHCIYYADGYRQCILHRD